jgi:HEAT repeat protein
MQRRRLRFTTRSLMLAVGICALIIWLFIWLIPIGYRWTWTWTVIRDVNRGQSTRYSAIGFASAGPRAFQALRDALKSDQAKTRMAAVQSLGVIGKDAKDAVPDLLEIVLHDQDQLVRIYAAVSLGQIGPAAEEAVEPLIKLLQAERDPQVVGTVIHTFHDLGPIAKAALPVLATMAKDPECHFRVMAAWAMCRIGPEGRAAAAALVPQLIAQLTDQNANSRRFAAEVLAEIGPAAERAIPALSAATEDQDGAVRKAAFKALAAIKPNAAGAEKNEPVTDGKP